MGHLKEWDILRKGTGLTQGNRYIIDSSAWIEYLEGTQQGKKVAGIIEDGKNIVMTPNIVAAEVTSKILRKGQKHEIAESAMKALSKPLKEEINDYFNAGKLHAKLREKISGISLADAIILTLAEKEKSKIVTKDSHLKGKNTVFLK